MKRKLFFATVAMLIATVVTAQSTITTFPYTEGFATGLDGWLSVDRDGDGSYWYQVSSGGRSDGGGNVGVLCNSEVQQDNWLISPALQLPADADVTLKWYATAMAASSPESYEVRVSATADTATASFDTVLFSEVLAETEWTLRRADLSRFAGQTIRIAFRHTSTDQWWFNLDDISIIAAGTYYIDATAASNGDGSFMSPFNSIESAISRTGGNGTYYIIGDLTVPRYSSPLQFGTARLLPFAASANLIFADSMHTPNVARAMIAADDLTVGATDMGMLYISTQNLPHRSSNDIGSLFATTQNLELYNLDITNCQTKTALGTGNNITIDNCNIASNLCFGTLFTATSSMAISNSQFTDNQALYMLKIPQHGNTRTVLAIDSCTVENNTTLSIIFSHNTVVNVTDGHFSGNQASLSLISDSAMMENLNLTELGGMLICGGELRPHGSFYSTDVNGLLSGATIRLTDSLSATQVASIVPLRDLLGNADSMRFAHNYSEGLRLFEHMGMQWQFDANLSRFALVQESADHTWYIDSTGRLTTLSAECRAHRAGPGDATLTFDAGTDLGCWQLVADITASPSHSPTADPDISAQYFSGSRSQAGSGFFAFTRNSGNTQLLISPRLANTTPMKLDLYLRSANSNVELRYSTGTRATADFSHTIFVFPYNYCYTGADVEATPYTHYSVNLPAEALYVALVATYSNAYSGLTEVTYIDEVSLVANQCADAMIESAPYTHRFADGMGCWSGLMYEAGDGVIRGNQLQLTSTYTGVASPYVELDPAADYMVTLRANGNGIAVVSALSSAQPDQHSRASEGNAICATQFMVNSDQMADYKALVPGTAKLIVVAHEPDDEDYINIESISIDRVAGVQSRDTVVYNYIVADSVIHDTLHVTLYDTLHVTVYDTVRVEITNVDNPGQAKIFVQNGHIAIEGAQGRTVRLYDAVGRLLATKMDSVDRLLFDVPATGTYVVKIEGLPARKIAIVR